MAKQIKERVEIGRDAQGLPVYKWATGFTAKEVHASIVRIYLEHGLIEGMDNPPAEQANKSPKFKAYVENWLEVYKEPKLKPTTYNGYISMLNAHLYPAFGKKAIDAITTEDVQNFLNKRKELAHKTLHSLLMFMGEIFKDALEDGLIQKNPTASRKLVIPSVKRTERQALTQQQLISVLQDVKQLDDDRERRLVALLLLTGMRRGEVLGLRWEDIDFDEGLIHVQRNVTYTTNQPHIGTPKTEKGKRTIPLDAQLQDLLQPVCGEGYVIGDSAPITRMVYTRMWNRIQKKVNLFGATAHVFRHSYLTLASNAGITPKTIQGIAGHADIMTTMNRYVHAQRDQILDAGRKIAPLFQPDPPTAPVL